LSPRSFTGGTAVSVSAASFTATPISRLQTEIGFSIFKSMDILRIVVAILLPPLGVFLQVGLGLHFWLNILLTLLGYIPGIVHAIWIIART
jgi:uncharacterized membrane protein YqaE (UPF0057 family)